MWFKKKARADPVTIWLNASDTRDILCPTGYTPLSKNEEIRRCTHKIADLVSNMTIMLMQNSTNGDIRIKNNLSKKVDISPNFDMIRKNFIYKIVTDMILTGNAVVLPKIKDGLIDNLQILNINKITFESDGEGYMIRYGSNIFYPDELLHFVLIPDDDYPYKGQGYSLSIKETVLNLLQANATKTGFLKSKWKPSMIMSINADVEELQDPEKRNKILGSYTKTTEVGEPWIIPAGEIDIKTIQPLTLQDLAIQDSITLDTKKIASAFGVPSFMVGIGEFKKDEYNNYISTVIMSFAQLIQQELSKKLLYDPTLYFKFSPRSLMQYDLGEKTNYVKEMVSGGMLNRNEGRNEFDYSPVDNEGMSEYIVLENYIPVAKVGEQEKLKGGEEIE